MSVDLNKVSKNIDSFIEQGKVFDGPLASIFTNIETTARGALVQQNDAKKAQGLPLITDEEINKKVTEAINQKAIQLKSALRDAANGNTKAAQAEVQGIPDAVGSLGTVTSAIASGNPLNIIGAIGPMMSNSFLGKYLRAGMQWIIGMFTGKGDSFDNILKEINFNGGISEIAQTLGVDGGALSVALQGATPPTTSLPATTSLPPPPTNGAAASPGAPAVGNNATKVAAVAGVTSDQTFTGINGVPPAGGAPSTPPGVRPPARTAGPIPT